METIVIAAVAKNGVIGRTSRDCPHAPIPGREPSTQAEFDRAVSESGWCPLCGGFGRISCNDIPWSYPEDLAFFRDTTMGHAVVMGRRTWESLPAQHRPLKGRTNIVVSHTLYGDPEIELTVGHLDADALDDLASDLATRGIEKLYVIGGAQLYAAALSHADTLLLTLIDRDHEGDVVFPRGAELCAEEEYLWPGSYVGAVRDQFVCVERRQGVTPELTFTKWVRR